jgi:hypothetical protein
MPFIPSLTPTSMACAVGPSVNRTLTIDLNCEKNKINKINFQWSKLLKIKYYAPCPGLTLGLKFTKSSPRNLTYHHGLSNDIKSSHPLSLKWCM